jgi:hypothetical protein
MTRACLDVAKTAVSVASVTAVYETSTNDSVNGRPTRGLIVVDHQALCRSILTPVCRHYAGPAGTAARRRYHDVTGAPQTCVGAPATSPHCSVSVADLTAASAVRQSRVRSTRYVFRHITCSRGIAVT